MLALYRRALRIRRAEFGPGAAMTWLPAPAGVLAFDRGGVTCVANLSPAAVELPAGEILLASGPVSGDAVSGDAVSGDAVSGDAVSGDAGSGRLLPPDTSAWLRTVRR
jgi:Domain of unknown function (DUF3459)